MTVRLIAAVVTVAQLIAVVVSLTRLLGNVPRKRRLINLMFPLSQLVALVYLFCYTIAYELPLWVVAALVALGVLCNVGDRVLFKALLNAESKELAVHKVALLEEQLVAQERHGAQLKQDVVEATLIRERLIQELKELDGLLEREEGRDASQRMHHAVALVQAGRQGFCAHHVIDALVTAKVNAFEALGVSVACNLDVPSDLPVPSVELCAVFSNLLDNALHSCEELAAQGRRDLSVDVRAHVARGYLLVRVSNDCAPNAKRARQDAHRRRPHLAEHGWGLSILKAVAERRDGNLRTTCENGTFVTEVALKLIDESTAPSIPMARNADQPIELPNE